MSNLPALADALATFPSWDATCASVVVVEGLLMFLPPAAVDALFSGVHAVTGPGSRVVFDTWVHGPDGKGELGRLFLAGMAAVGEPWVWSIPDEAALETFLARRGFSYHPDPARFDPRLRYIEPAGIDHRGWNWFPGLFAVAERARGPSAGASAETQ